MRRFFEPTNVPAWLKPVLASVRAALGDVWDVPMRPFQAPTAALPPAAEHEGGIVFDTTLGKLGVSNRIAWLTLVDTGGAAFTGNVTVAGTFGCAGNATFSGNLTVTGATLAYATATPDLRIKATGANVATIRFLHADDTERGVVRFDASKDFIVERAGAEVFKISATAVIFSRATSLAGDMSLNGDLLLASGRVVKVNGTQVVTAQQAAVADATGAGDVVAQLNTLLARLRTHGLIGI